MKRRSIVPAHKTERGVELGSSCVDMDMVFFIKEIPSTA